MGNNAPDYENLFFEKSIELNHSEKMRDYTAEYVVKLEEKLEIAKEALKQYADKGNWQDCLDWNGCEEDSTIVEKGQFGENGYTIAEKALEKIGG